MILTIHYKFFLQIINLPFISGHEVSVIWTKLRSKFSRVQLKILRRKSISENDKIIHQHLIYLKEYISTKNVQQFDEYSDTVECCKECYQYDVSSDEDLLAIANADNGSLPAKHVPESQIKTEPQNEDVGRTFNLQNEISIKEEPAQDNVSIPTITISDSDDDINTEENHNLQISMSANSESTDHSTVQDVKPKIEKTAETLYRKGIQIMNRKPFIKGKKGKIAIQDVVFDCNFPKAKTEKKNVASAVDVALQSLQSSVLIMKRKKTISQYAVVMNNHLQMLPEEERLNCLMEVLEIIESFK